MSVALILYWLTGFDESAEENREIPFKNSCDFYGQIFSFSSFLFMENYESGIDVILVDGF